MPTETIRNLADAIDSLVEAHDTTPSGESADKIAEAIILAYGAVRDVVDGEIGVGGVPAPESMLAPSEDDIVDIARVCHEVNRGYCASIGDHSQLAWDDAPESARSSAVAGVRFTLANPDAKPEDSHNSWLIEKAAAGWRYGPVKNPETKQHPCIVAYVLLPHEQKVKDHLFQATVRALAA